MMVGTTALIASWRARQATRPVLAAVVGLACAGALYFGSGKPLVSLSRDPHEVNCLPELHVALLLHVRPAHASVGDYLFWRPSGALSYVAEQYVLKRVAGVPGDKLVIKDEKVFINGKLVVQGLENAVLYKKAEKEFAKNETIPADSYFVIGTAAMSNDSRYWGYLHTSDIVGRGYRIY